MKLTPNLSLKKPDGTETADIDVLNGNADSLDAAIGGPLTSLKTTDKKIVGAINELFQSASDIKSKVADAVTGKGVPASINDTGQQLADKIGQIKTGTDTTDATAVAADIRSGKTAYGKNAKITGTQPVQATAAQTITPGKADIVKGPGIYDGAITVKGVPVDASKVLVGTTIAETAGTLPNRSAENQHMPSTGGTVWAGDRLFLQPPPGYYNGSTWVTVAAPDVRPEHIRSGKKVLDMAGTLQPGRNFRYLEFGATTGGQAIELGWEWQAIIFTIDVDPSRGMALMRRPSDNAALEISSGGRHLPYISPFDITATGFGIQYYAEAVRTRVYVYGK
ncbi:hypothetical protein BVG16_13835 [Paenibacillus selenitireducens]|uniref:Tail fiber protein n=1 Tax=Paenibacillus selenitireducens TaxID=1324314 RepID=A0A1T2XC88_9BACL|nr:hypothetical protein [Paenibacillus selenitireducens]OPA77527.1 hypothetical protein BVG16_13835 [Paenibacillus selenitireducens]